MTSEPGNRKICVLGSINLDIVASVKELPLPGETVVAQNLAQFPGGKGANQAVAAACMDVDTLMMGATGADPPGNELRAFLQEKRVNTALVKSAADQPTGQAFINVSECGENSIVIVAGANGSLSPSDIAAEDISSCGIFLAQLETPVETVRAFFELALEQNGITILNAAPAGNQGAPLFPLVDIVIVNEAELATYAGLPAPQRQRPVVTDETELATHAGLSEPQSERPVDTDEAELAAYAGLPAPQRQRSVIADAARRLISRDRQTIIVTLGADGVMLVNRQRDDFIPSRPANAVDTTGAGDCFCGVFAAGLALNLALPEAVNLAVTAASISVERPGAATSIPTRAEVEAALSQ